VHGYRRSQGTTVTVTVTVTVTHHGHGVRRDGSRSRTTAYGLRPTVHEFGAFMARMRLWAALHLSWLASGSRRRDCTVPARRKAGEVTRAALAEARELSLDCVDIDGFAPRDEGVATQHLAMLTKLIRSTKVTRD
jgi:hypothetical protein